MSNQKQQSMQSSSSAGGQSNHSATVIANPGAPNKGVKAATIAILPSSGQQQHAQVAVVGSASQNNNGAGSNRPPIMVDSHYEEDDDDGGDYSEEQYNMMEPDNVYGVEGNSYEEDGSAGGDYLEKEEENHSNGAGEIVEQQVPTLSKTRYSAKSEPSSSNLTSSSSSSTVASSARIKGIDVSTLQGHIDKEEHHLTQLGTNVRKLEQFMRVIENEGDAFDKQDKEYLAALLDHQTQLLDEQTAKVTELKNRFQQAIRVATKLQERINRRQEVIEQTDSKLRLLQEFPALCEYFAKRQAELTRAYDSGVTKIANSELLQTQQ